MKTREPGAENILMKKKGKMRKREVFLLCCTLLAFLTISVIQTVAGATISPVISTTAVKNGPDSLTVRVYVGPDSIFTYLHFYFRYEFSDGTNTYIYPQEWRIRERYHTFTDLTPTSQLSVTVRLYEDITIPYLTLFSDDLDGGLGPIADAGPDQDVVQSSLVSLDGSNSDDPYFTMYSYLWTQTSGSTVVLSDPTAISPTFTAPGDGAEELTFELTVTDSVGFMDTDTCIVNIVDSNGINFSTLYLLLLRGQ